MNANYHAAGAPTSAGHERRAFERLPVRLPAQLRLEGSHGTMLVCEIRNFCVGGMFVVMNNAAFGQDEAAAPFIVRGAILDLSCSVPTKTSTQALQFRARVVRQSATGLGLAFINPDFNALQAFHEFAIHVSQTSKPEPAATTTCDQGAVPSHPAANELLERCARSTARHGARLIQEYLAIVGDKLARQAAETDNFLQQNTYLDAVRTIEAGKSSIQQSYTQALVSRLKSNNPDAMATARASHAVDGGSGLSLVEDDALDAWLALTETTHHIETVCQSILYEIEQRLGVLFRSKIDSQNNPFGPAVFVLALEDALNKMPLEHEVVLSCFKVFKYVTENFAPQFYGALNQFLIDQQVTPDLNKRRTVQSSNSENDEQKRQRPPAPDTIKQEPLSGEVIRPSPRTEPEQPQPVHVLPPSRVSPGNLYQLIGSLQSLRQGLQAQRVAGHHGTTEQPYSSVPAVASAGAAPVEIEYTTGELVSAISALEQSGAVIERRSGQMSDLKTIVQTAIKHHLGTASPKQLGTGRTQVIEVANSLFRSLSQDQMLSPESHAWLEKIELTLLKLALIDQSVFESREHVARQFINKLAQLGFMCTGKDDTQSGGSLPMAVNQVVDEIVQKFDGTSQVFTKAAVQLDDLVKDQQRRYDANLRQLIQACEKRERASGFAQVKKSEIDALEGESRAWVKHAMRMEPGTSVLFNDDETLHHLRLAWTNPSRSHYVFANLRGHQEQELSLPALAKKLAEGDVAVMDGIEEQPIDRAQFSIMKDLQAQFTKDAQLDALTGVCNRREFERRLKHALQRAHSEQVYHALCHIDIDKFQVINNTWGYGAGDAMLKGIAQSLRNALGDRGTVGRLASDEFMMLLEDVSDPKDASAIVERLVAEASEFRLQWEGIYINVRMSVGMVIVNSSSTDILDFMRAAQSGCSLAKKRSDILIHAVEMDDTALAHHRSVMDWIGRIDELLDEDRLALVCQKIAPLDQEQIHSSHYEVLLRVREASGELRPAGDLIIAAEEYQRITSIDKWVVRRTLHWMAAHRDRLDEIGGIAINLSGLSLSDTEFMDFVLEQLVSADILLEKVCFEITETAGIGNLSDTVDFILEMKETGCLFSLDDFGTGLSSYDYLKKLPVDFLKIDGSFVQDICKVASDYAMVKSITEIGHFMGKRVIAEHAGDSFALEQLRQIGVDYVQGFAIAKPVPMEQLFALKS